MAALPDEVRALLEARNFAHLATALPDGSARAAFLALCHFVEKRTG